MDETNKETKNIAGVEFVRRIDHLLDIKSLNRKKMADDLGFSQQNISRWKTLGSLPDVEIGVKIADYLNVNLYWLITGKDEDTKKRVSAEDQSMIDMYMKLDRNDKEVVLATLKALSKKYIKAGFEGHNLVD